MNQVEIVENHFHPLGVNCNSKGLGLTYSNPQQQGASCESMKTDLFWFLKTVDPKPVQVWVAQEAHKDGSPHYHAYIRWLGEHHVDHRHFDWNGVHPNIQFINNVRAWQTYMKKEDKEVYEWVAILTLDSDDDDLGYLTPEE